MSKERSTLEARRFIIIVKIGRKISYKNWAIVYMTVHHLPFFSPTPLASGTTSSGSAVDSGTSAGDVVDLDAINSPRALSRDALPSGTLLNQPPGKNRDDAVDSSLLRGD